MNMRLKISVVIAAMLVLFGGAKALAQCADPAPSVLKITDDSVTLTWPAVTNATGYEYAVQPSAQPQPTSGTPTTATTVGVGGLPYSAHTAWVRTDCGSGNFSNWASISFTIVCSTPGTINISGITDSSATITWAQVGGITSYEYVLNNFSTDPPGPGTPHSATSYQATGLVGGTDYYMHIRTDCGGGKFSAWQTEHFTTLFPSSISTASKTTIKAYPNPVSQNLTIEGLNPATGGMLRLMNSLGSVVYQSAIKGNTININMQKYAPGLYFVQYNDGLNNHILRISRL